LPEGCFLATSHDVQGLGMGGCQLADRTEIPSDFMADREDLPAEDRSLFTPAMSETHPLAPSGKPCYDM